MGVLRTAMDDAHMAGSGCEAASSAIPVADVPVHAVRFVPGSRRASETAGVLPPQKLARTHVPQSEAVQLFSRMTPGISSLHLEDDLEVAHGHGGGVSSSSTMPNVAVSRGCAAVPRRLQPKPGHVLQLGAPLQQRGPEAPR